MHSAPPWHLLFPLASSLIFVLGLMLIKRAGSLGVGYWTITFTANLWAALIFLALYCLPGTAPTGGALWQPLSLGVLFVVGQIFTFAAISRGDVSVAAPVLSLKLLLVAVWLTILGGQPLTARTWTAAGLATLGVVLVQAAPAPHRRVRLIQSVFLALAAATTFSLFDVLVQSWAPAWGPQRFLPLVFGTGAVLSLALLPLVDSPRRLTRRSQWFLLLGTFCIAAQSLGLMLAIAFVGDAARVNIVYALRGMWGVLLAFCLARRFRGSESRLPASIFLARLWGAGLLTLAVLLAIVAPA